MADKEVDAVVFGFQQIVESDGQVVSSEKKLPDSTYICNNFMEILNGPIRHMYGVPGSVMQDFRQKDVMSYKMYAFVWCWCYRKAFLDKYSISFKEDLVLYEDGIFDCEVLMHAQKINVIPAIGYEYYYRNSGGTATQTYSNATVKNKFLLVKYRAVIRDFILQRTNVDISEWTYGSYVLSIFQLCVALSKGKHGYSKFKEYVLLEEVQKAIQNVPLKGKPKFVLPFFLVKIHCYRLLYTLISIMQRVGVPVRL